MRILLSTFGSRGDTEPLAALAAEIRALGAEAVICAPSDDEFAALLDRAGVPLAPAFTAIRPWVARAMADQPPMPLPERAAQVLAAQYEAIGRAAEGCDAILATGLFPSVAAARTIAEVRGLPYVFTAFCPLLLPNHHFPPFSYPGQPNPPEITDNRALWAFNIEAKNAIFGGAVNAHRASLGLAPVDNVRDWVFGREPWLACDPVLGPWPPTDLSNPVQAGAWILPDTRPLDSALEAFLNAGPPPVYVGFGSMPMAALKEAAAVAAQAVRAHGRRMVLAHGWAELALPDTGSDLLAIGEVNQQALFPRVAAAVHHGGAGTTTAAARSGRPQVIVPQVVDQPYWAARVAALGIGAAHDGPTATAESLSAALEIALRPETADRAAAVAPTIRPDGATTSAKRLIETLT